MAWSHRVRSKTWKKQEPVFEEFDGLRYLKKMQGSVIPFGYELDEARPGWYKPIEDQIKALTKAFEFYHKGNTLTSCTKWLKQITGRSISLQGFKVAYFRNYI